MAWLKRHLTEIFCVLFLSVVVGVVAVRNYTPGTFLTGIDNFHIEFDLGLAWSRAWSGVWQENQGVGIVSGLAQMSELPRVAIYQVLNWVLPINLIRYVYVFGNLYLGVVGVFFLTWYVSKSRLAGLAGALFYLFNLGTLQVFFMPTDMFVANYAALPWLFLLVFKYLSEGKRVSLLWYVGLLFLFAPMAMTPTIFVVYLLFLGIICVGHKWKRVLAVVGVTLGMSMYFLLPFANFALNNASVLTDSKINSVFSQENYLMNGARTGWGDLATLKGMWFDYPDNVGGKLVPLMGAWDQYLANVGVWIYVPVVVMVIGIVAMLWKKKRQGIVLLIMGVVSLILLRGENPPIGSVVAWLRSLPLVAEAFRTPYTKIAPILTLVYAVCFGYGIYAFGQIWRFRIGTALWKVLMVGGVMVGLSWLNLPYFQGKLISEGLRVKVPSEYFEMIKFFKTQDKSGRVVRLPAYSSQAWDYTDWGYRGSGFLWYGIEQPILDRAFDVWSPYNEGFYDEFSTALYGCGTTLGSDPVSLAARLNISAYGRDLLSGSDPGCKEQVAMVLQKYDVRYVLLDESVIAPGQDKEILRIEQTKKLASELGWEEKFHEGFLTVWDTGERGDKFVSAPESYTWVSGDTTKTRRDVIYGDIGHYVSAMSQPHSNTVSLAVYPFAGMMREEVKNVEYGQNSVTVTASLPQGGGNAARQLVVPDFLKTKAPIQMNYTLSLDKNTLHLRWEPVYLINGQAGPKLADEDFTVNAPGVGVWARIDGNGAVWVPSDGTDSRGRANLTPDDVVGMTIYLGQGTQELVQSMWKPENVQTKCGEGMACIALPLSKSKTEDLVKVVLPYEGTRPQVCIDRDGGDYRCENNTTSLYDNPIQTTITARPGELDWLDITLRGSAEDLMHNVSEPQVVRFPRSQHFDLRYSWGWGGFFEPQTFTLQGPTPSTSSGLSLKVEVAGQPEVYDFAKLGKTQINNCDVLGRGEAQKLQSSDHSLAPGSELLGTKYTADKRGAACDYVDMTNLDTRLSYLMRMQGQDTAGRSLKFFLYNTGSKRNDLEYLLGTGKFDQTFALLPWEFAGSYTLNTETRSFGQYSENTLQPVEVRWFPIQEIAGAKIVPARSDLVGFEKDLQPTRSDLRVTQVTKTGTWLYRVKVEGSGLLKLSQGYDEGWVSIGLPHVKVDGWANGWIIPESWDMNNELWVLYWPQLLEYLGFVIMGGTELVLIFKKKI